MKANRASKTAMQVALSRAIESQSNATERVCDDPFARRFLSRRYSVLLASRTMSRFAISMMDRLFYGHHYYVVSRTRCFDELLIEQIPHVDQVVILGAGYDSRAYRLDGLSQCRVFEVDHPATSADKRARIAALVGELPRHVAYVPLDFAAGDLGSALEAHGYDPALRTAFLWEGTTPYLQADAVDATLDFIRRRSAPGSTVIFDYVLRSVIDGTCTVRGAQNEFRRMSKTAEPFTFGIDPSEIESFLADRGFGSVRDWGADELRAHYWTGSRQPTGIKAFWRIVRAAVEA